MNASKETEEFIEEHTFIKQALKKGLVNYSALARLIKSEFSNSALSTDAIIVAARRYTEKIKMSSAEKSMVVSLLKKSRVEVKNRVYSAVFSHRLPLKHLFEVERDATEAGEPFHLIEGTSSFTVITSEEYAERIRALKDFIIKSQRGLVEITIKSPREIEKTPGVVAYLYALFSEKGINIVETTSCWTDTIFVIKKEELQKALEILRF